MSHPPSLPDETPDPPKLVLDTNVLLDWLVFRNPEVDAVIEALQKRQLVWVTTTAMREEFDRVLTYEWIAQRQPDGARIRDAWAQHAQMIETAPPRVPMRCQDPDDQKFIDLAVALRARWLLTKDRELLKLAKRARAWGVAVLPAARWSIPLPPTSAETPQAST